MVNNFDRMSHQAVGRNHPADLLLRYLRQRDGGQTPPLRHDDATAARLGVDEQRSGQSDFVGGGGGGGVGASNSLVPRPRMEMPAPRSVLRNRHR